MSRSRPLVAGLLTAVVAILATAPPASAHDQLISSDPAHDAVLAAPPSEVSMEFSDDILDMGAAVVVADESGTDRSEGEVSIDGPVVTVPLQELPGGSYEVRWRVVSSDGHPISGVVPFSVEGGDDGAGDTPADAGEAAADEDPAEDPGQETAGADAETSATDSARSRTATEDGGTLRVVLVAAGGAVVALGLLALVQILRRRRNAAGADDTEHGSGTSGTP
ncbi:copper resistance CopC family protein [Isoptericola sp. BMS4]|uniref:copper resistance CopC family protein n=1 Tax=Isoptericola sp. BMS4 TaxID=2527875 RepID=UPI00142147CF|nr:copper resistance CopC family protein [Isoptericola sp. BMS4]